MTTPDPALVARCAEELRSQYHERFDSYLSTIDSEELVLAILAIATPSIRAAALEEAAKVCDQLATLHLPASTCAVYARQLAKGAEKRGEG